MFLDVNPSVLGPASSAFKRCSKCGEFKESSAFSRHRARAGGLQSMCRDCYRDYTLEHQERISSQRKKYSDGHREEIRAKSREYTAREYEQIRMRRLQRRDKEIERRRQLRKHNPETYRDRDREYRARNPDRVKEIRRRSYVKHIDKRREGARNYRSANPDSWRNYAAANPDKIRRQDHARRARKLAAGGAFTATDLESVRAAQTDRKGRLICWRCGKPIKGTPHLDHWIPLAGGGTNDPGNLHYMHPKCNMTKSAKHPTELGRLL